MATKLIMPKLGLNMVEGEVTQWLKKEGDSVTKGEIVYVVETDKVTNEVEAPEDGILAKIFVKEGEVVPVRRIVGVLAKQGEQVNINEILGEEKSTNSKTEIAGKTTGLSTPSAATSNVGRQWLASPLVKRMAAEKGIDLGTIKGTGPGGRIMAEDLYKSLVSGETMDKGAELPGTLVPFTQRRKITADRMTQSSKTMAMVTLNSELDVLPIVDFCEKMKSESKSKSEIPGINAILVFLVARALKDFPFLNASFTDQGIRLHESRNIGLAVDSPDGLLVVVLRDADKKPIIDIHKELNELVERALNRKSRPEDLEGSTFTITNLGMYGVDSFNPIINPPEAGILGVGRFKEKLLTNQYDNMSRYIATFSLTFDHRIIDGAPAAQFLQRFQELIVALGT